MRSFSGLIVVLLLFTIPLRSINTDSLFKVATSRSLPEAERYKAIALLEKKYRNKNADTCFLLVDLLKNNFPQRDSIVASYLLLQGTTFYLSGAYDSSLVYFQASLQREMKVGRKAKFAALYNNLSSAFERKGMYDSSLIYAIKSLDLVEKSEKPSLNKAMALYAVGNTYRKLKEFRKALPYFEEALKIAEELDDKIGIAASNSNIGNVYNGLEDYKTGLKYFDKAYTIYKSVNDSFGMGSSLNNKGIAYAYLKNYNEAKIFYRQAYQIRKKIGDVNGLPYSAAGLAQAEYSSGNLSAAERLYEEALQLFQQTGVAEGRLKCYKGLELNYKKSGNAAKAYEYINLYYSLKDSLYNIDKINQISSLEAKYQNEKKSLEIDKLNSEKLAQQTELKKQESEKQRQQLVIYLIAAVALGISAVALVVFRTLRLTRKQKKVIEEQKLLVEHQKELVEEKQKEILDSIYYARRIQKALLAPEKIIQRSLQRLKSR